MAPKQAPTYTGPAHSDIQQVPRSLTRSVTLLKLELSKSLKFDSPAQMYHKSYMKMIWTRDSWNFILLSVSCVTSDFFQSATSSFPRLQFLTCLQDIPTWPRKGESRESLMSHKHPGLNHSLPQWNIIFCRIGGMRFPYVNYSKSRKQTFSWRMKSHWKEENDMFRN